ncbi:uncharacterized protein LOC118443866 [Vespa mandarinia]|uniref:uncharacterized protein LOC118443866 n=1 Tax=Vespa mandarinia TaxID=7446 RepID=UPI00161B2DF2|nr:uncharacterized protein LOC118443866 [Vespa mandarinia]
MDNQIEDAQRNRDRRLRGLRSRSNAISPIEKFENLHEAWRLIRDLENYGPAGLVHLVALAYVTGAVIRIWNSQHELQRTVGKENDGIPIDIEFHLRDKDNIGHWTFRGRGQPKDVHIDLNNCLFSVIAEQTGINATKLRQKTIQQLKRNVKLLANYIKEIQWLEENNRIVLLIGGARYIGISAADASKILDDSQNKNCHGSFTKGHPRGHASAPYASGRLDSVESYSKNGWKSAFLNRDDQDKAAHVALSSPKAQIAMEKLNKGSFSEQVYLNLDDLGTSTEEFNKGIEFVDGYPATSEKYIRQLVLVIRHHEDKYNDPNAPVFVHTFYPKLY